MIARLNATARRGAVSETIHGVRIDDPYRGLEEPSEATQAWIDAQTSRTARALAAHSNPDASARIEALLSIGSLEGASVGGTKIFYEKREGDREQPRLFVIDERGRRPLIDPERFGERAALDWYYPSPRGRYLAFGISERGDERSVLRVLEVSTGEILEEAIERTKWADVEWLRDETAFYYSRYPAPGEPEYDAEHEDTYHRRIFFHRLGEQASADPMVYAPAEGTDFAGVTLSEDERWLVINVFRGWSNADVYLWDRGEAPGARPIRPDASHPLRSIVVGLESVSSGVPLDGRLLLLTNEGAPRYRLLHAPLEAAAGIDSFSELVPERDGTLESFAITADRLALSYIEELSSRLRLFTHQGEPRGEVALPEGGSITSLAAERRGSMLALTFSSYLEAPSLILHDAAADEERVVDRIDSSLDLSGLRIELVYVESADGTRIPLHLIARGDMVRDGTNAVLLYGYGGFNVSLLPTFTRSALYWLERGGVYAVAHLRGGGELGEAWHRAGSLENKERVFEDFEAALSWLTESRISAPARIAITGGSNGGLLMGAMLTRVPERFAAAASYVGLYDMLRYHLFAPAELWIPEYGSPERAEAFRWLHAYSPYHQVRAGTPYPAALIETADHDSRVHWGHSTKFAAALQEATSSERPIYFHMEREVGHGAGTRRSDTVARYVRMYAFLEAALGPP